MEGSGGAFSQEFGGDDDDPFAGSEQDFGLPEGEQQPVPTSPEAEAPPPPVVNREGEPVEQSPEEQPVEDATQVAAEQQAAEVLASEAETTADGSPADAQGAGEDPTPGSEPQSEPSQPSEPEASESETGAGSEQPTDPPAAATDGAASAASEAAGEPGGTDAPTSASSEAPGAEAGGESGAEAEAGASGDSAAPPQEKEGGTKRQYKLFTPDGAGKFSEVSWHEKAGKVVEKGTSGAKKQTVVLARGQEDALQHGFAVMGAPTDGVSLVAVASTYWQVKRVQPDPVQPVRQRLRIS